MQVEDVHRWHEEIFARMAKAGWVESFVYTEGQGWFVTWTMKGAAHAQVLKALAEKMSLLSHDRAALAFDAFARGEALPPGLQVQTGNIHPLVKHAWREAVDELELARDEDGLLILLHLVKGYAPDQHTPVKDS